MAKAGFRLALLATLVAPLVVLLGAYTRLTHSGLGCPDGRAVTGLSACPAQTRNWSMPNCISPRRR